MSLRRLLSPRVLVLLGLSALFLVYAWPMQVNGWNQNAHYALVRALADGVPYIDKSRGEIGELGTGDVGTFEGHVYSVKPPGLAMFTLPAFWVVDAAGMRTTGDPTHVIWALHLWSAALPGVLLVLLVGLVSERLAPGRGAAAAALCALATLVLPFSTMLFNHVLSTLFAFGAFALLWLERERGPDLRLIAAAGIVTGLGVTVDFQVGFGAPVLLLYAALRRERALLRAALYSLTTLVGALPLLAFNAWAFGSPLHTPYEDYHGVSFGDDLWLAYVRVPSLAALHELFLSPMGLLVLMPVLVVGLAGVLMLYRAGRRADALAILGIVAIILVYHSGVGGFGGQGPPRYLTTLMPFLALGFAPALARIPLTTLALGGIAGFQLVVQAATGPLAAYDGDWLGRVSDRLFVQTGGFVVEVTGWYTIAVYFLAVAVVVVVAALLTRRLELQWQDLALGLAAVGVWATLALAADNRYGFDPSNAYVATLAGAIAAGAILWSLARGRDRVFAVPARP